MKRRKSTTIKDRTGYYETQYDEMKVFLSRARALVEQDTRSDSEELEIDIEDKREKEKTKEYTISSGKLVIHAYDESELNLTDDEKTTYQETMDDFIEQVSDLVDYEPLNLYKNDVEWGGVLIKYDTQFIFSLGESNGIFITCKMARVDEEFTDTLEKLKSFYKIFSSKWAKVLANRKSTETEKGEEPANEL
jgi:hypothetical protein